MPKIQSIKAHKIVNSRGDWTIQARVTLDDGSVGVQTVPDGASKGENEAICIPAEKSAELVSTVLNDALKGKDPFNQTAIDEFMINMDGTPNKEHLGGNSILAVSLSVAAACAVSQKLELYQYLSQLYTGKVLTRAELKFPTPVFNIINGGKHAQNNLSFQEFMVIPAAGTPFEKSVEIGVKVYHELKDILHTEGFVTSVGDEGGFAPGGLTVHTALTKIKAAAQKVGVVGKDIFFGMDVAAESFCKDGKYNISEEKLVLNAKELGDYYGKLLKEFELIYVEDGFYERDTQGWKDFYALHKDHLMVVADDLVVTNPKFLKMAIDGQMANAVIVKPNQVGSLTETFRFVKMAQNAGMHTIVSHRSGETGESSFIADLALAVGADFIKSGAPVRGERVVKYNRLLDVYNS